MVLGVPGTSFIDDLNLGQYVGPGVQIIVTILIFLLVAGCIGGYLIWNSNKKKYNKRIIWFEESNGIMTDSDIDMAMEMVIPLTNVRLFYIKGKDMYLPRLTRRMGKNTYWVAIKNNKEIVNFTMTNINNTYKEAGIEHDHTDMRYAEENLRKIVNDYRKQNQKWWEQYKDVIGLVILIFVLSISFFFLLSKVGVLVDKVGVLVDKANTAIQLANNMASGVSNAASGVKVG